MPAPSSPQRVLVIDDDEIMRHVLETLLSAAEYQVTLTASVRQALDDLSAGLDCHLILTDLQMPDAHRSTLAKALRAAMPPGAVLLAMSAARPDAATLDGFDGFLQKPFDADAVRKAVTSIREAEATRKEDRSTRPTDETVERSTPPLDLEIVRSLRKIITGPKLGELYEMTIADVLKRQERMLIAASAGDLVTVKREAHATKGSCGMVGAQELQRLAARIEDSDTVNAEDIGKIPQACEHLRRMLKIELK